MDETREDLNDPAPADLPPPASASDEVATGSDAPPPLPMAELEEVPDTALTRLRDRVQQETGRVLVGMEDVVDMCLVAIVAGGHVLLEGPPGVAKTLLVRTLAASLGGSFSRITFTPDLMPADVTGTSIFHPGDGEFHFRPGPVFGQFLLCDEVNRAPAKTQSALLEAMQEGSVTIDGERHDLPRPFVTFATMNPIEHEGTYPLPEAQLDRFFFNIFIGYPSVDEEREIIERTTGSRVAAPARILDAERVLAYREVVYRAQAAEDVVAYAVRLVRATRPGRPETAPAAAEFLSWGAGPRAAQALLLGAKARALLDGRPAPAPEDVRALAHPVLRHRLVTNFHAEAEEVTKDAIIDRLLDEVSP